MLILLLIIQLVCVGIFALLVLFKNKVSYFGLSILFLQFVSLVYVIFFRIFSNGISFGLLLYIIFIPAALPNVLKFFSTNEETKIKMFLNDFTTRLDQNFFNLTLFNQISFYLSRKLFKKLFIKIQKKLYDSRFFFGLLFLPYVFLVSAVVIDILIYNRIYFSPIFLSLFFFFYRFFLLILRINEYYSKEGVNYLQITFRKINFQEPILHFQKISNFLNLSPQDLKNSSFLIEKWYIYFTGICYSSAYILSTHIRTIILPLFFNLLMWILFFFTLALVSFNLCQEYPVLFFVCFLIVTIPLSSLIYVLHLALKKIPEVPELKLFHLEVAKQKALFETLNIFKINFHYLELTENLIIPKNRPPINLVECFNHPVKLIDPQKKKNFIKEFSVLGFCFVVFSYYFLDTQSFTLFGENFSWFKYFVDSWIYLTILKFLLFSK